MTESRFSVFQADRLQVCRCRSNMGGFQNPVEATLFLIGGKYKPLILWYLIGKPLHYMELQRMISKAMPKMLSQQLRGLEECGMMHREVIPDKPPRTICSLTTFGRSIIPVLNAMCNWGTSFLDRPDIQPSCRDV